MGCQPFQDEESLRAAAVLLIKDILEAENQPLTGIAPNAAALLIWTVSTDSIRKIRLLPKSLDRGR
jgi:hypothetical protein